MYAPCILNFLLPVGTVKEPPNSAESWDQKLDHTKIVETDPVSELQQQTSLGGLKYIDYTYMYIIQDLIESLTCMML
jgi:hypothetical protein